MKTLVAVLIALALAAPLGAQTLVSYEQQIYLAGVSPITGSPMQVNTYGASAAVCNQVAPTIPTLVVNPTTIVFDDPANVGKVCLVPMAGTSLPALPNGVGYLTTITVTDDLGQVSARSAASNPFNRQGGPLARTGLRVK